MRRQVTILATLLALLALLVAGCGSDDDGSGSATAARSASGALTVSAAASLQDAFDEYGRAFGDVRFSFAGSDELAAQIRQGIKPDLFAAANTSLPDGLFRAGLVERPVVFAGNRLVLAVPAQGSEVASVDDLEQPGVKIAIGSETVPIGAYTRRVLGRLPAAASERILANVRSEEPDVKGIVGKLTQGAVDAGFVYVTDVTATRGALKAIDLPASLEPSASYGVAIVRGAKHAEAAQRFIDGLLDGSGQQALSAAGFEPPPTR